MHGSSAFISLVFRESQSPKGCKRPVRLSSPTISAANPPRSALNRVPRCHCHTFFEHFMECDCQTRAAFVSRLLRLSSPQILLQPYGAKRAKFFQEVTLSQLCFCSGFSHDFLSHDASFSHTAKVCRICLAVFESSAFKQYYLQSMETRPSA